MKITLLSLLCLGLFVQAACAQQQAPPQTDQQKISYTLGYSIGYDFARKQLDMDPEMLIRGMRDALTGSDPALNEEDMRKAMTDLQQRMMAKQQEQVQQLAQSNAEAGRTFLAANRQKEGVKTTSSGLQYRVIGQGAGKKPSRDSTVTVHYRGRLLDGTEFDNSYKRNQPATFQVGGVIPGWTEALQLMQEGARWRLYIPSELAYGERGAGPMIGPNATLIFDVELISVK